MIQNAIRPRLPDGGTIAIVAPSGHVPANGFDKAVPHIESLGYEVKMLATPGPRERFLAAPDAERARGIMDAFRDPGIDAVLAARGGYGSARLLPLLDFDAIAANPKPFAGFSDGTALQLALLARANLVSYTGTSVFPEFKNGEPDARIADSLWPLLRGEAMRIACPSVLREGDAEGPLVGGCLSLIVSLLGTPYMPDMQGAILLLEDVNEQPFRVDRMLTQLRLAGVLDRVAGIVFGQFAGCGSKDPGDGTVQDVLDEVAARATVPVVAQLAYGHVQSRTVLPVGATVRLRASTGSGVLAC